jgi:hypothetical protein
VKIANFQKFEENGGEAWLAFRLFFIFFLNNHVCFLFCGKYRRMQLFGYGVRKNPSPIPLPKI